MNRCLKVCTICFAMGFSVSVFAQTPDVRKQSASRTSLVQSKDRAYRLLTKPIESVDWMEKTLEEIVEWLEDESEGGVNVIPRWVALGAEGVNNESIVTLKLKDTTVAEIMGEVLEELSEDGQVTYHAVGNILRISTTGDFDRKLYLRVYDVTDILFRVPNFGEDAPLIDLSQTVSSGAGGGGGGGQSVFQGSSSSSGREDAGEQADQKLREELGLLMATIASVIEPQSWGKIQGTTGRGSTSTGTGPGRMSIFNRSLIVYNTIEVHEQISGRFSFGK